MKAFFVALNTSLSTARIAAQRRKLATLLRRRQIELQTLKVGDEIGPVLIRLVMDAKATPVVAVDDAHPLPNDASWLADLTANVLDLVPLRRPQLVYVTGRANADGTLQALRHPVVRHYVSRDNKGKWVDDAAEAIFDIASHIETPVSTPPPAATDPGGPSVVGASRPFRAAVEELQQIVESPYGLVTGAPGVGKMFLIRRLWQAAAGKKPLVVLPCGSFFKDYYVGGKRRRFGGGREAVDQLAPYLVEANHGMLVLHHVEQLPSALQEELAVRLTDSSGSPDAPLRMPVIDSDGLTEYEVRVLATSTFPPEQLRQTGRLTRELAVKLRKRHVRIPTLKERGPDDVRLLCGDLLRRISIRQRLGDPPRMDEAAVSLLATRDWPENISDLVRVLEHALRHCRGGTIRRAHLPKGLIGRRPQPAPLTLDKIVADAQRTAIENTLEDTGGDVAAAAKRLGVHKGTLYRYMKALAITVDRR